MKRMTYAEEQAFRKEVDEWQGMFEASDLDAFKMLNQEVISEIGELKKALAEYDNFRHVWAEVVANNAKPGRDSEFRKRIEIMQGKALRSLANAAWRLRVKLMRN